MDTIYYDTGSEGPKTDGNGSLDICTGDCCCSGGSRPGGGGGGGAEREQHINNVRHLPQFNG